MYVVYSLACVDSNPAESVRPLELDDGSKILLPNLVLDTENISETRRLLHKGVDSLCNTISIQKFLTDL